ncbi:MAG: response regulator, partial [Acidobacteriota bacterium]
MDRSSTPVILIVDDEPLFLSSVVDATKPAHPDWTLLTASDGEKALTILRSTQIDLLVTDLKMPKVDGVELLTRLSQLEIDLPRTIVVSAYATEEAQNTL